MTITLVPVELAVVSMEQSVSTMRASVQHSRTQYVQLLQVLIEQVTFDLAMS